MDRIWQVWNLLELRLWKRMSKPQLPWSVIPTWVHITLICQYQCKIRPTWDLYDSILQLNYLRQCLHISWFLASPQLPKLVRAPQKSLSILVQSSNVRPSTANLHNSLIKLQEMLDQLRGVKREGFPQPQNPIVISPPCENPPVLGEGGWKLRSSRYEHYVKRLKTVYQAWNSLAFFLS